MKIIIISVAMLLLGLGLGLSAPHWTSTHSPMTQTHQAEEAPLYWVAPMDANYQRDKPGKSPMGMDLVPVYATVNSDQKEAAGTIFIQPSVENNLGVKTAIVQHEALTNEITAAGYVRFDQSQLWQINTHVDGWVEKLFINAVGDQVNKGDTLFTLYSHDLIKAQEELLNAYRTQRKGMINAATERLLTLGVQRTQINHILKQGRTQRTIAILAPEKGVIANLNIREGSYLSPAKTAMTAGPLDTVWVEAEVFERQAYWLNIDTRAEMHIDALPGQKWQGKVDYIYPIIDPKTRALTLRLRFDNHNGQLKPNMFTRLTLTPKSAEKVLTIPRQAVIRTANMARVVLAMGDGKYRSVRIEMGRESTDKVEVLAGLQKDDIVVTSAHFLLDSESSQQADLSRINSEDSPLESVWTSGEIITLMPAHHMINISHQPVPEWEWPAMVMDFTSAKSLDLSAFSTGQHIDFLMKKQTDGQLQITDIKLSSKPPLTAIWITGEVSMVMADFGMITIRHPAVEAWQWEAGEINFSVPENIDLSSLAEADEVTFLVEKSAGEFVLTAIEKGGKTQ